jgi:hypothetical protein
MHKRVERSNFILGRKDVEFRIVDQVVGSIEPSACALYWGLVVCLLTVNTTDTMRLQQLCMCQEHTWRSWICWLKLRGMYLQDPICILGSQISRTGRESLRVRSAAVGCSSSKIQLWNKVWDQSFLQCMIVGLAFQIWMAIFYSDGYDHPSTAFFYSTYCCFVLYLQVMFVVLLLWS